MGKRIRTVALVACAALLAVGLTGAASAQQKGGRDMEKEAQAFLQRFTEQMAPLEKEAAIANYDATISGKTEDFAKASELEIKMNALLADKETFRRVKELRESKAVKDPLTARQLEVVYLSCLGKQLDLADLEALVRKQKAIEEKYYTFRVAARGKTLTDNDVEAVLRGSTDSAELREVWEGSKQIGPVVAREIRELARLRNETARKLGFADFHAMQLTLSEQDPAAIGKLFDELDALTRDAFAALKKDMDAVLAKRLGIEAKDLRPWHYQDRFFQEAPRIYPVDLDKFYQGKDVVDLNRRYFAGIGLPVEDILARSDLYEKPGKYQHAYCTDIDRSGDVRILCNVKNDYNWTGTLLHELGHAVYDKYMDRQMPWLLRTPAHTFTTEAVAMFFGRMAAYPGWLQAMAGVPAEDARKVAGDCARALRLQMLVFSRWAQVMYRFEKALYENPDQDLDALWWRLVEKYQMVKKPEGRQAPDWAAKIHVATVPAYYHNYLLGELLASQFLACVTGKLAPAGAAADPSFAGRPELGAFFREAVFGPGARYPWNDMIRKATGEPLTAKYFARQFVGAK